MGKTSEIKNITLLFDTFSEESRNLNDTFKNLGQEVNAVSLDDNGFLPDGVISPYGFFLGDWEKSEKVSGKPLFFNQIKVPEYWEISGSGSSGKITDHKKERGHIFFTAADNSRLVKVVDWLDDSGIVRMSEHYNRFGAVFCRTFFNAKGQKTTRSFFDAEGREKVYENFVTDDYIVDWAGKDNVIHSKTGFIKFFFECSGLDKTNIVFNSLSVPLFVSQALRKNGCRDVLFWNEPVGSEIPGNMRIILNGQANRAIKVYVQHHTAYEKLISLGASPEKVCELGYVYSFERENGHGADALILTNSDNIEHIEDIVKAVPEMHFNIAALTEMSPKLMALDVYDNVSLYPGVKRENIGRLLKKCDIYLDINHEAEIVDAVHRAFINNAVIFAFNETVHNRNYVAPENIFNKDNYAALVEKLHKVAADAEYTDETLRKQHEFALAEDPAKYDVNGLFL